MRDAPLVVLEGKSEPLLRFSGFYYIIVASLPYRPQDLWDGTGRDVICEGHIHNKTFVSMGHGTRS